MKAQVQKWIELIKKEGIGKKGFHELDFSREEHRECFCGIFGGREHMEKEYPKLYALMLKTAEGQNSRTDDEDTGSLQDLPIINSAYSNKDKTGASGIVCLTSPAKSLFQYVLLSQDGEIVQIKFDTEKNVQMQQTLCEIDTNQLPSLDKDILCIYTVGWVEQTGNLKANVCLQEHIKPAENFIDNIEVVHPCYFYGNKMSSLPAVMEDANTQQPLCPPASVKIRSGPVVAAYARSGSSTDIIDYNYPEKRVGNKDNEVFLDVRGEVVLSAGYEYDKLEELVMTLEVTGDGQKSGDGAIRYAASVKDGVHIYSFSEKGKKGFRFAFPTDWKAAIPDSSMAGSKHFYLEATVKFLCKDYGQPIEFSISSTLPRKTNVARVPAIQLKWGCLGKDALVEMADGSSKKVSEILIGDCVRNADGTDSMVEDILTGTEEELIYLKVQGYDSMVGASMNHPFMTPEGSIFAGHVDPSTRLKMRDGEYHQIEECYREIYQDVVYSLKLEGSHWFYADGFVTGDHIAQGEGEERLNLQKEEEDDGIQQEFEKLKENFVLTD